MSRYRRAHVDGASYFFTVNTYRRQPLLTLPAVRVALREAIEAVRLDMPFVIDAWVLLPDHLHAIWTLPEGNSDFGKRWGRIKAYVSKQCSHLVAETNAPSVSRVARRELDFWQRRFWEHQLRDDRDFEAHVDYVHYNPVKHGYVVRPIDWEFSTFRRYVERGVYSETWASPSDVSDAGE